MNGNGVVIPTCRRGRPKIQQRILMFGPNQQARRHLSKGVELASRYVNPQAMVLSLDPTGRGRHPCATVRFASHHVPLPDPLHVHATGVAAEDGIVLVLVPVDAVEACGISTFSRRSLVGSTKSLI